MTTMYKTQNKVPSSHPKDFHDNSMVVDNFCNSQNNCIETRENQKIRTLFGINRDAQEVIDGIMPNIQEKIDSMVIESEGVEIAGEFGDSPQKAISQELATLTNNNVNFLIKNTALISNGIDKLSTQGKGRILCVGDSITYGQDEYSADKIPPSDGHVRQRAPIQYPAQLEKELRRIYSSSEIETVNYGYSGDTVKSSFERDAWKINPQCDLAIIMFGINDQKQNISISEYMSYFEQWIQRLNSWRCGVIIALPTVISSGATNNKLDNYRIAAKQIANLAGCPVVTTNEFIDFYQKEEIYSDNTHYNKDGYRILGNSFAWYIASGCKYRLLTSDITIPSTEDFCVTNGSRGNTDGSYNTSTYQLSLAGGLNKQVTFPLYLNCDAAEVFVNGIIGEGSQIIVDSDNMRSKTFIKNGSTTSNNYKAKRYTRTMQNGMNDVHIANLVGRGWHSITITSPDGQGNAYIGSIRVKEVNSIEIYSDDISKADAKSFIIFDPPMNNAGVTPAASSKKVFKIKSPVFANVFSSSLIWASSPPMRIMIVSGASNIAQQFSECIVQKHPVLNSIIQLHRSADNAPIVTSVKTDGSNSFELTIDRQYPGWIKIIFEVYDAPVVASLLSE